MTRKHPGTGIKCLIFFISSGHVRNIHFPFDIEMDTSTAVASEMVEELALTDHDVSVIAAMIDSEVQAHIPDWAPREPYGRNKGSVEGSGPSSPTTTESSNPIVMERLPSGRKYWSDSPKASAGNSPHKLGPSNLILTESVVSRDSWSEENNQSPAGNRDGSSYEGSPHRHMDCDLDHDAKLEHSNSQPSDAADHDHDHDHEESEDESPPLEENTVPSENESDGMKDIMDKLEHLMEDQKKELEELKKKHEVAISDTLNELPEEVRLRVLIICNRNRSEHNIHYRGVPFDNLD